MWDPNRSKIWLYIETSRIRELTNFDLQEGNTKNKAYFENFVWTDDIRNIELKYFSCQDILLNLQCNLLQFLANETNTLLQKAVDNKLNTLHIFYSLLWKKKNTFFCDTKCLPWTDFEKFIWTCETTGYYLGYKWISHQWMTDCKQSKKRKKMCCSQLLKSNSIFLTSDGLVFFSL